MGKNGFVIYKDWALFLDNLTMGERGELFSALFEYVLKGKRMETENKALGGIFNFMAAQIDRDSEKYQERCNKNRENQLAHKKTFTFEDITKE